MSGLVTVYDGDERRDVDTPLAFDAWLDAIAAVGSPGWVEVTRAGGRGALAIALGRRDLSSLRYVDHVGMGAPMASVGTLREVLGGYDFDDRGLNRPVPAQEAISVVQARAAVREFVQTGQRPTSVAWHPARPSGGARAPTPPWGPWSPNNTLT